MITASAKRPATIRLSGKANLQAAASDGQPGKIEILAYTGGMLPVNGFPFPVVVDVSGLSIPSQVRPILIDHDDTEEGVLGQTTAIAANAATGELTASGMAIGVSDRAQRVKAMAAAGYEWQASIGAFIQSQELIAAGRTVEVNGQRFVGPVIVARKATLREISFVPTGADDSTVARIAASAATEGAVMTFEEFVASLGLDPATLSEVAKAKLTELFMAQQKAATPPAVPAAAPAAPAADSMLTASALNDFRASLATEIRRTTAITTKLKDYPDLQAKALEQNWGEDKVELELLRASRPKAPAGYAHTNDTTPRVLEAALSRAAKVSDVDKQFTDQELSTADRLYRGSIGLKGFLMEAAAARGFHAGPSRFNHCHKEILQAAFSMADIGTILSNVQGKKLLEGWKSVEQAWREIASIEPVSDFKQATFVRLTSAGTFKKVGPTGELSHGSLGNDSYTNQAETFGELLTINRQMQINDDLSALSSLPRALGRKGGLTLCLEFWTKFLNSLATLFPTDNSLSNYFSGGSTNLQISSLTTAVTMFGKQTDSEKNPLGASPAKLLVPAELGVTADEIFASVNVNTGGSSTKDQVPNKNVHGGKYKPVVSAYLSNSTLFPTLYSLTRWFLTADPMDLALMQVVFLDGQEEPKVETADADFGTLGISARAYIDFGVNSHEYRAGVMSKGAA